MRRLMTSVGYADLVRCLRAGIDLPGEASKALGFQHRPPERTEEDQGNEGSVPDPVSERSADQVENSVADDLQSNPPFWLVEYRSFNSPGPEVVANEHPADVVTTGGDSGTARVRVPFSPLLKRSERATFVESLFPATSRAEGIDVGATVERLCRRLPPQIVRAHRSNQAKGEVIVLVDIREPLFPLTFDYQRACRAIADRWGHDLVQYIMLPSGVAGRFESASYLGIADFPPESRLVLLSDTVHQGWFSHEREARALSSFRRRCVAHGHQLIHWRHGIGAPNPEAVRALLGALAFVRSAGPHRLRFLRKALDDAGIAATAADEVAVWGHSERDTDQGVDWQHQAENRYRWIEYFESLDAKVQRVLSQALERFSIIQSPELRCVEQMLAASFGHARIPEATPMKQLHELLGQSHQSVADEFLLSCRDCLSLAAPRFSQDPEFAPVYRDLERLSRENGLKKTTSTLRRFGERTTPTMSLVQRGSELFLVEEPGPSPVLNEAKSPWFDDQENGELVLGKVETRNDRLVLRGAEGRLLGAAIALPAWAKEIWRSGEGLLARNHAGQSVQAVLDFDDGSATRLSRSDPIVYALDRNCFWSMVEATPDWAENSGLDDYGFWAEFTVNEITQRMRWIPPGEFLMGSPEDEPKRDDDEGLHRVTLTQGYWLAETACTQALWEAVMGSNPSGFKGSELPVEEVSWGDVGCFIEQLNYKLPGLQGRLPTEAEWEYAARAGSQTPFWWGSTLLQEQANYQGSFPYGGGEKEKYRRQTVPVKEFEPNPWGLYQVHGNVWEWCKDWYGDYESGSVVNPRGAESGERRVYRGGSWSCYGWVLRAACRVGSEPDYRFVDLGFRLSAGQSGAEPR